MTDTREQAATRRRWISLAEFVAVAGLLIGAATLYLNWSDRREDRVADDMIKTSAARQRARISLSSVAERGGKTLSLRGDGHEVQDILVRFPSALVISPKQSNARPTIEANWFEAALLKETDGGQDDSEGRLPVLVTAHYLDGDVSRSATDTYDIIWRTDGRLLRGRSLSLDNLRLRRRGGSQADIDAVWKRTMPQTAR